MKSTKKERTYNEIMEAAKNIIHDKGHEAITVRSLAEVTGYAHTNLYYYFKDMNALLWALRINMIEDMINELTSIPIKKEDPVDEIQVAFLTYTDYFLNHPNVFRFFYFYPFVQPEEDNRYQKLEHQFQNIWQTSFSRLVQEGIIKPEDVEITAKTIIYALQGMIMLRFSSNGSRMREEVRKEIIKLIDYLLRKSE